MESPASWHVLMPSRTPVRTSYPGSDSGQQQRKADTPPIFQPDGSVNAQIAEKAAATFWSYDTESKGSLERGDLVCALGDMGAFQNIPPKMIGELLALDAAGHQDRRYSLHEFLTMYMRLAQQQAKLAREGRGKATFHTPEPPPGAENNPALRQVFGAYCQFARGTSRMMMSDTSPAMVAQQLHRLCQDIGLVGDGGPLYSSSVDIVYVRCQAPGSHRLNFQQWLKAIAILSDESGWDLFRLLMEFAYSLGTKGLPAPVDPTTMLPPKPGMAISALPQLHRLGSGNGRANGSESPQPRGSGGGGPDDPIAAMRSTLPASANGAQPGRIRPLSSASQRPPRFNNLVSSPSGGIQRDVYSPVSDYGSPVGDPRSVNGERSWTAFELGQLDPSCLPPWLAQVLDRLQAMEAQAMMGDRRSGGGGGRGPRGAVEEQDVIRDTVQSLGQRLQAAEAAAAAAAAACLGAAPPGGSEMATALASLPPWLQSGYRDPPTATNRQLQEMVAGLERQLQAQRQEGEATMLRLQQLEAKAAGAAGSPGGGVASASAAFEDRLRRCEIRLDGHDAQLARAPAAAATAAGATAPGQQPLDGRVTDLEHHLKTYSVSLLSAATSAASAGECAAAASERSRGAEAAAAAAAARLEQLERRLQERGLVHEPGSAQELAAAAAAAAAPTQQQLVGTGLDPGVAEQLVRLPALGLDAQVWAEVFRRLGKVEQEAREAGGKLSAVTAGPALAPAAGREAGGKPSAAEQKMLEDGLDPKVAEQLGKLSALGMDPLVIADVIKRQGRVEQEVEGILKNPAAAAAGKQAAARAAAASPAGAKGKPAAKGKGTGRSPAEQQLLDGGMEPKVAEQLGRLSALGVDPAVLADLIKRMAKTEQEVKQMAENSDAAGAGGKAGAGGAPGTAAVVKQMVDAGLDPGVAEQLGRLTAVGVDPTVFAAMVQRLVGLEEETRQLGMMRQQLDEARKSDIDQMNDVLAALQQENTETRNLAAEAQAGGMDAAQRADALTSFAEALAAKHDGLEAELREVRDTGAAGARGADGRDGASDAEALAALQAEMRQLAGALGEVSGRCTAMERDLAMALTSYASIVDLKESENHVLDRHQQLHDEIETLKENIRTVHEEVEQLTAAMVVAAPSIASSQHLPGVVKQSVHMGQGGGGGGGPLSQVGTSPSRSVSKSGFAPPALQ